MNINLYTWFTERQLDFCPKHFIKASTPIDDDKLFWVLEKLQGRFYLSKNNVATFLDLTTEIYFEDSQEAMLYELTWS